ncbi:MAG TPA: NAD-dependent dehydratase, partial [Aquificaceae bacterium]|nr:NAD-dependent dehydratase [Aquificaceae bacterium]
DEAKRFSEALCMAYCREHDLDVRIARIFNTYGPRMRRGDGRVIPTFIEKALKGESLPIYGNGSQTRSFCYIDDLVEGLFRLSVEDGLKGEVINLGNPEEIRVLDLAKKIIELTGSSSKIEFLPPRPDDPPRRCPDISKAKRLLNWWPQTSLEEGLKKTIEWFRRFIIN